MVFMVFQKYNRVESLLTELKHGMVSPVGFYITHIKR